MLDDAIDGFQIAGKRQVRNQRLDDMLRNTLNNRAPLQERLQLGTPYLRIGLSEKLLSAIGNRVPDRFTQFRRLGLGVRQPRIQHRINTRSML